MARVGCVACLASLAVAPRLPSPCSCSVAVRWAWTQSHYAFVRDPIPQAFSPHPGDSPVEPGPRKSAKSLEFEVGPRALGRIRPGAGGTGTNSDRCHRCLKSGLGAKFGPRVNTRAKFGPEVEPGSWIPSWNQAWELDSDLKESLRPGVEAPIDVGN